MYEYSVIQLLKIVDGDTVDVLLDLGFNIHKKERVRLSGIDAPESKTIDENEKKFGLEAKEYITAWFVANPKSKIRTTKDDKYGRILGEFFGISVKGLSESLIEDGYAWVYDGGKKTKNFALLLERRK